MAATPLTIGLDLISGEKPLAELFAGCIKGLQAFPEIEVHCYGNSSNLHSVLKAFKYDKKRLHVVHASEVIGMDEDPSKACRSKRNSSLMVGLRELKEDKISCLFTPGNTGATLAGALLTVGRIPGILRPAIACPLPTDYNSKIALFLDGGANVDCNANYLKQFALMGSFYYKNAYLTQEPRVGLMNVGEESKKGNLLTKEAFQKISELPIKFVGNVEAKEFFEHKVDVAVCDGFVGNVFLKTAEATAAQINGILKREINKSLLGTVAAFFLLKTFRRIRSEMNASNFGAAPLLGVAKPVLIGHGKSDAQSVFNAIKSSIRYVKSNCIEDIAAAVKSANN